MTEPEAPRIEFPCAYPIKVMGEACVEFRDHVHQVMERHAPGFDRATITVRALLSPAMVIEPPQRYATHAA